MTRVIERSRGNVSIAVAPELGGALAWLRWRGHDVLRPFDPAGEKRANLCGSYPLVPWSNRIADGQFSFAGQRHRLVRNFGDSPHAVHGIGWQSTWEVVEETASDIVIGLERAASEAWPWPWRAEQRFTLTDDALTIALCYRNLSEGPVPAGLGFHPFFANAAESQVRFPAERVWLNDEASLPKEEIAVPEKWDYKEFRTPVHGSVDNCFCGWNGEAAVRWPSRGFSATLTAPGVSNAVFFIPGPERNVVAIEPVSHINNAINLFSSDDDERAMDIVNPGDALCLRMTIRMSDDE
ncbi:aldose 1-epimerase [Leminorella grimontii]|uniref:aldose 1-epimerase n=1 Tax=Leminorella grimontii TaxID=82981 RepID=UPI00321F8CF9